MIFVETIKNYPIDSNCFVIYNDSDYHCIIIDPGTKDSKQLIEFLTSRELQPNFIILTHSHFDHILGVNLLRAIYNVQIVCSSICNSKISDQKKNLSLFYDTIGVKLMAADILVDKIGFKLKWGEIEIIFLNTPGHSDCSISILIQNFLFSGDLFIKDKLTITKLPGGSRFDLVETTKFIRDLYLEKGITLYPGHGNSYSLNKFNFKFHLDVC
jgi:hydroxyacylglutathione hydrolase